MSLVVFFSALMVAQAVNPELYAWVNHVYVATAACTLSILEFFLGDKP